MRRARLRGQRMNMRFARRGRGRAESNEFVSQRRMPWRSAFETASDFECTWSFSYTART